MEHKRTMTSRSHYRHYESWPGCAGEAAVKVQRGKGTRMSNSPRGGSNREVVRKEISVRIIIACGHDRIPAHESSSQQLRVTEPPSTPCRFLCTTKVARIRHRGTARTPGRSRHLTQQLRTLHAVGISIRRVSQRRGRPIHNTRGSGTRRRCGRSGTKLLRGGRKWSE